MAIRSHSSRYLLPIMSLAVFLGLLGCGASNDAEIRGVVTLDGKPLGHGVVSFVPAGGGAAAYGGIAENGAYRVHSAAGSGLMSGVYVVLVASAEEKQPIIPAVYGSVASTPLRATVGIGLNAADLNLASSPKEQLQQRKTP